MIPNLKDSKISPEMWLACLILDLKDGHAPVTTQLLIDKSGAPDAAHVYKWLDTLFDWGIIGAEHITVGGQGMWVYNIRPEEKTQISDILWTIQGAGRGAGRGSQPPPGSPDLNTLNSEIEAISESTAHLAEVYCQPDIPCSKCVIYGGDRWMCPLSTLYSTIMRLKMIRNNHIENSGLWR